MFIPTALYELFVLGELSYKKQVLDGFVPTANHLALDESTVLGATLKRAHRRKFEVEIEELGTRVERFPADDVQAEQAGPLVDLGPEVHR